MCLRKCSIFNMLWKYCVEITEVHLLQDFPKALKCQGICIVSHEETSPSIMPLTCLTMNLLFLNDVLQITTLRNSILTVYSVLKCPRVLTTLWLQGRHLETLNLFRLPGYHFLHLCRKTFSSWPYVKCIDYTFSLKIIVWVNDTVWFNSKVSM